MAKELHSVFLQETNRLNTDDQEPMAALRGINQEWALAYFSKAIVCIVEVSELQKEIELILSKISHQKMFMLTKVLPIEELILYLKLYLIAWSTMKDLMAKMISEILDLGIMDTDLSSESLLRNEKVKKTRIPEICSKHNKTLNVSKTNKARNDAVHRGKLSDDEVMACRSKKSAIESKRYSLIEDPSKKISSEEYDRQIKLFYDELKLLVEQKRAEYQTRYEKTIEFYSEIAIELAHIYHKTLKGIRI
ncbi:MAG: Cthe_2314 family HEPN domain-containing protein [Kiritimatiellales bacterium]|nr:Cthe_2314 family HEPN domain-containing protein [Kiritimatiellales bacterium]